MSIPALVARNIFTSQAHPPPVKLTADSDMIAANFDRITVDPEQMNGQPCIRGMRLTVRRVVEAVSIYPDRQEFFKEYPELKEDDVRQALGFAAANLEDVIDFRVA